jgi:hypothetical protein
MISGILDRGESLSDGSQRSCVGVGRRCCHQQVLAAGGEPRTSVPYSTRSSICCGPAVSGACFPETLGHRVSLFPHLEAYGRAELRSGSHLRADASASGPVCVSIGRYHGRPISEDNGAWRSSWLRCAQRGERPQAPHPRRYLGPADRERSGAALRQQRLYSPAQVVIVSASFSRERIPLAWLLLQSRLVKLLDLLPAFRVHCRSQGWLFHNLTANTGAAVSQAPRGTNVENVA